MNSDEALKEVRKLLKDTLTERGIEQWLNSRLRYLKGERAVDVLKTDPDKVIEAAEAYVSGAYL